MEPTTPRSPSEPVLGLDPQIGVEVVGDAVDSLRRYNIVQTVVLARLSSTALRLHPIITMSSTIAGAAVAGVLGATLATPATAARSSCTAASPLSARPVGPRVTRGPLEGA